MSDSKLDILAFGTDPETKKVLQHIESGYFREFFIPLQRYRELNPSKHPPYFGPETHTMDYPLFWEGPPDPNDILIFSPESMNDPDISPSETETLQKRLTSELLQIVLSVKSGFLLKGTCDICRDKWYTVSDL